MTILLSGATGFLGSYLLKRFVKDGFEIIALKRSTSSEYRIEGLSNKVTYYNIDKVNMEEIFKKHHIDIVLNTATDYGRKNHQISSILETNLMFSLKLLENAIENNIKVFINTDTLLDKDINVYALSKNQLVQWMHFLSNKMNMVNIKIEHMYGPLDDDNKFIYWVIKQLKKNVKTIDLTSGIQKRDFIYIDDIVEAYLLIINNIEQLSSYEEFELGSGKAIKVKEFLEITYKNVQLKQRLSTKLNFGAIDYREKENMCMEADVSKLQSLGWSSKTKLEDGIKKILDGVFNDTTRTA